MKRLTTGLIMLAAGLALIGCSGADGEDGKAYGVLYDGCSCITGVDLTEVGVTDPTIIQGQKYKLDTGIGTIYWATSVDSTIWYYDADIEPGKSGESGSTPGISGVFGDGDDGKDRVYTVYLYYGSIGVTEEFSLTEDVEVGGDIPNGKL